MARCLCNPVRMGNQWIAFYEDFPRRSELRMGFWSHAGTVTELLFQVQRGSVGPRRCLNRPDWKAKLPSPWRNLQGKGWLPNQSGGGLLGRNLAKRMGIAGERDGTAGNVERGGRFNVTATAHDHSICGCGPGVAGFDNRAARSRGLVGGAF